jgi:hypothetical protein
MVDEAALVHSVTDTELLVEYAPVLTLACTFKELLGTKTRE